MGKYSEDTKELLRLVGGKENIAAVSHCMTRMRFALVDPKKADVQAIEAMKVVKGSFTQSGQFQVIIGNTVADFYNDFVKAAGIEGVSKDAVKQAAKKNQNVLQHHYRAGRDFCTAHPGDHYGRSDPWFPQLYRQSVSVRERNKDTVRDQPVLGGDRQLFVADRRSDLPYASGWYLLVCYKENGDDADAGDRTGADAGIRTVIKRLCCCRNGCGGYPQMEFWQLPGKHDRLSGAGDPGDLSGIYPGISGKILPEDHAPGDIHDRCTVLQSAVVGHCSTFCIRADWLEDRCGNLGCCICRHYRNL